MSERDILILLDAALFLVVDSQSACVRGSRLYPKLFRGERVSSSVEVTQMDQALSSSRDRRDDRRDYSSRDDHGGGGGSYYGGGGSGGPRRGRGSYR